MITIRQLFRQGVLAGLGIVLAACAGPVAQKAFDEVADDTARSIGSRAAWLRSEADEATARAKVESLLAKPLGPDDAVQIALLANRRLQADLAELGLGAADLTASWRPGNPGIGFGRMTRGSETEIERSIGFDALGLLLLPLRAGIESRRFDRTRLQSANDIVTLARQTRRAWFEAVAAEQAARYVADIRANAEVQLDLARKMRVAGNNAALDVMREQLFYAEATARLARHRLAATMARERLARLMGLWGNDLAFRLPERLPDLPAEPRASDTIEAAAIEGRFDVRMARAETDALARNNGLTQATRFIDVLEVGLKRKSESAKSDQTGYEIRLELPLFDFGDARASRAEFAYLRAVNRLADIAVDARSEARQSHIAYRTAFDIARHYTRTVLPLRRQIGEEMVLRYNGMLVSVFDLLADAREQIADVTAALEAQRDFWLADTDLTFATLTSIDAGKQP